MNPVITDDVLALQDTYSKALRCVVVMFHDNPNTGFIHCKLVQSEGALFIGKLWDENLFFSTKAMLIVGAGIKLQDGRVLDYWEDCSEQVRRKITAYCQKAVTRFFKVKADYDAALIEVAA